MATGGDLLRLHFTNSTTPTPGSSPLLTPPGLHARGDLGWMLRQDERERHERRTAVDASRARARIAGEVAEASGAHREGVLSASISRLAGHLKWYTA